MDSPLRHVLKEGEADTGRPEETDTGRPEEADTGRPEEADTGKPEEADTGRSEERTDTGRPEEADTGRPEEADTGRPEEADTGRPAEADTGRPEEADTGRPEETPACAGDDEDIPSSSQTKRHNLDMDTHTHLPSRETSAASDPIYRFIIIGKTGTGKSTVGNIILGGSYFPVGHGMVPVTTQALVRSCENIQVLDTPDISDLSAENRKTETERWRRLMSSEPSAVLLTVRCDLNFTAEELGYTCYLDTRAMLQDCFPLFPFSHRLVVVFTFGDRCAGDLDTTLQTVCPALEQVLPDAGGRYVLFNDTAKEDEKVQQRQKLLEIVDKMGKEATSLETVNSPPETKVSPPETKVSQPETEVSPPETGASPSKAEVSPTEMEVGSSETEVSQLKMENSPPETAVSPPDTGVCPPKTGISPPDSGISPPEVEVSQAEKEISSAGQHVERRVLLIGKTGTGKSTVGNILLGRVHFPVGCIMTSTTTDVTEGCSQIHNITLKVVDTPDISEMDMKEQEKVLEVSRWKARVEPGHYAVVLTVRCDRRYTAEEYAIYQQIKKLWKDNSFCDHLVVALTFGDRLDGDLDTQLKIVCPELQHVLRDAGKRYVLFNDMATEKEKGEQREKLVHEVNKIGKEATSLETVDSPPETKVSPPETKVSQPETEVSPPETGASPSKAEVSPTEMELRSSETEVSQPKMEHSPPETAVSLPDTGVCPPKTGISPPDSGISPPEMGVSQAEKEISSADQHVERRVLLIGKTGTGKSTVGNILLGRVHFPVGCIMTSTTTDVTEGCSQIHNITLKVVDTPDISEMDMKEQEKVLEVSRWKARVEPGHYAVVLTVRCDRRYTAEEYAIYQQIKKLWKDNSFCDHLVVALTFGDRLDGDLDTQLKIVCPELQHVLRDAGKRYVLFNDMATEKEKGEQIDKLMHEVNKIAQELANSGGEKKSIRERLASWDAIPGRLRRVLKK